MAKATKKSTAKKTAPKKGGRHPGPMPAAGWPKDRAKAAYIKAGGGTKGDTAARKIAESLDVANHRIVRWLTKPSEFKAALAASKTPAVKKTTAKKAVAKKAVAKKTVVQKAPADLQASA